MASLNKVQVIGNLGADPESRVMPSGDAMTSIKVATTESWKDKSTGEKKEQTEWHRISFFGKLAEIARDYLKKGSQVYVEGSLRTRKYMDKDGVEKYSTEIKAETMQMLGNRTAGDGGPTESRSPQPRQAPAARSGNGYQPAPTAHNKREPIGASYDDDIPFAPMNKKAWGI